MQSTNTKILIEKRRVISALTSYNEVVQIDNGNFDYSLAGWRNPSGEWYWNAGEATFMGGTINGALYQQPINLNNQHGVYSLSFTLDAIGGYLTVGMGSIFYTFSAQSQVYTLTFDSQDPLFGSLANASISFTPGFQNPVFSGSVARVLLSRESALNDAVESVTYDRVGYVYPEKDSPVAVNYEVAAIQDVGRSIASQSKTIRIAGDASAEKIFGHLSDEKVSYDAFDARYRHRASIIEDDEIVFKGSCRLTSVQRIDPLDHDSDNIYELVIYDDIVDFSDAAGNYELSNIDLTDYDHILSFDAINSKSASTVGDVYCYPTLNRELDDPLVPEVYQPKDFFPAFYFMDLWNICMSQLGYTYTFSDSFVLDKLNHLVLPYCGQPKEITDEEKKLRGYNVSRLNEFTYWGNQTLPLQTENVVIRFANVVSDPSDWYDTTTYTATIGRSGEYKIDMDLHFEVEVTEFIGGPYANAPLYQFGTQNGIFTVLRADVRKNGQLLATAGGDNEYLFETSPPIGATKDVSIFLSGATFYLEAGDEIQVRLTHINRHEFYNGFVSSKMNTKAVMQGGSFFKLSADKSTVDEGSMVFVDQYLPNLTFGDLVNFVRTKFNLNYYTNEFNPFHVQFDTRAAYYSGATSLDLTDKFDSSSESTVEFIPEVLSAALRFTDQDDSDNYHQQYSDANNGETYGEHTAYLDTDLYTDAIDIGPKKIASTPIVRNFLGHYVPALNSKDLPRNQRVLFFSAGTQGMMPIRYVGDNGPTTGKTPVHTCLHVDSIDNMTFDLNFGVPKNLLFSNASTIEWTDGNMYNRYWRDYVAAMNESKLLTGYFWLTPADMSKINKNLNSNIYFNGQNYYINKVIDYVPSKRSLTQMELLQIAPVDGEFQPSKFTGLTPHPEVRSLSITNIPPVLGGNIFMQNLYKDGAAKTITDLIINNRSELTTLMTEPYYWYGGIGPDEIGWNQLMMDKTVIVSGGSPSEIRSMPDDISDSDNYWIYGGSGFDIWSDL